MALSDKIGFRPALDIPDQIPRTPSYTGRVITSYSIHYTKLYEVLISPSREFVAGLPNGKIPDRRDFANYTEPERIQTWKRCVRACRQMADEFSEIIEKQQLAACLQAL